MKKNANILWVSALILGWLFDLLFWKQPLGLNFALYSLLCVLGGVLVLWLGKQYPDRRSIWLLPLIVIFAAVTAIRAEPLTAALCVMFTLLLMLVLSNTYLGGRWYLYGLADYLSAGLRLIGSMIVRPLGFSAEIRKEQAAAGVDRKRPSLWPVVRGIAIALPILAIFAALLASADAAFNDQLDAFLRYFQIENLPQYIFRMAYILVGAYLLAGVILHASTQSADEKLSGEDKPFLAPFLGMTEASIVLGSVALLFAAFVAIQFRYFFGGQANITVAGFTYAEYARRGFGELVTVAFFSLLMIRGLESITRRETTLQRRLFSGLSVATVALVMVMLVSAYQRLILYETAYGFSRLRTYTHVALFWIGILLVAAVALEILQRQRAFVVTALLASLGFALSLAILNVDGLIVQENVDRAIQGHNLDVPYLVSLSTDAVPALVVVFEAPSTPTSVRDAVGAVLFCRLHISATGSHTDWQSFTFSRWQADADFKRAQPQLAGYHVLQSDWPVRIDTPAGTTYDCYGGVD